MVSFPFNPSELAPISPRLSFSFIPMKDISLFLLKNSFASKMKRGIRNFCHNVGSTSTLNQNKNDDVSCIAAAALSESNNLNRSPKTLEEMLLQLDLEEAAARRAKLEDYGELNRRMSCVNNSDILRSARNALNQYPRFSLDGRDAMYRSSFRNLKGGYELDMERSLRMPATVSGECVVWCKPSVVAKLMGLDAVPIPVARNKQARRRPNLNPTANRNHNLRRMGRCELQKDRVAMNLNECGERLRRESFGSSSGANGYCATKPSLIEKSRGCGENWQFRHAR